MFVKSVLQIGSHKIGQPLTGRVVYSDRELECLFMPRFIGVRTDKFIMVSKLVCHRGDETRWTEDVLRRLAA